ncbi:hypothetical protein Moror_3647 [Moniliophthora roreri MCA 2997]|uniref:Uncharacterized protein n=2 Tax=Moniliophthora roreri TaxID=221103 RepID=V2WU23_MONRO|nr:hypothetical protein Moror_3647 [Moniliophthora roreri MCA 2997]
MLEGETDTYFVAESAGVHPFLLLPLATTLLVVVVAVFKWRFPCTTVDALVKEGASVQKLLTKAWKENLLGDFEEEFTRTWRRYYNDIEHIKLNSTQVPDSRAHPLAWIRFQWRQLHDIDVCYTAIQTLSASITLKSETERNRRYFTPFEAYSSGINTANSFQMDQIPANSEPAE